jgi:hypothetical protein
VPQTLALLLGGVPQCYTALFMSVIVTKVACWTLTLSCGPFGAREGFS